MLKQLTISVFALVLSTTAFGINTIPQDSSLDEKSLVPGIIWGQIDSLTPKKLIDSPIPLISSTPRNKIDVYVLEKRIIAPTEIQTPNKTNVVSF